MGYLPSRQKQQRGDPTAAFWFDSRWFDWEANTRGKRRRTAHSKRAALISWVLSLCFQTAVWAQADEASRSVDPVLIRAGQSISATQNAKQPVTYLFDSSGDRNYVAEIEQNGLDFVITVQDPVGSTQSYDSPLRRDEPEYVLLDHGAPGRYRITITSNELTRAHGSHSINFVEFAAPGARNGLRLKAMRLMAEGAAANADANALSLGKSAEQDRVRSMMKTSRIAYGKALQSWQELEDPRMQARAAYSMAMIEYWDLYDWAESARLARLAAEIYQDLNEQNLYASTRFLQAYAMVELAGEQESEKADETFQTALNHFEEVQENHEQFGNLYDLADVLNFVGYTHHLRGEFHEATLAWNRAAPMFGSIGEWRKELNVRQNLAVIDLDQGYAGDAINTLQSIVDQIPEDEDPEFEAAVLVNLGIAHRHYGNIDEALRAYTRALTIHRKLGDHAHVATSLRGLGASYYVSGEFDRATEYLRQALAVSASANDRRNQAVIFTYLGNIAYMQADYLLALKLHQDAVKTTQSGQERASRQVLVARDLVALGRNVEAITQAESIISSIVESPVTTADAYLQLGKASIGIRDEATDYLEKALGIYESLGLQEAAANASNGLAVAALEHGYIERAIDYGEASLDRIESLRTRVSAPELRAFYSASKRNYYETQIDLLMTKADQNADSKKESVAAALSVSERARARMMVDLLSEATHVPTKPASQIDRRGKLYEEMVAKSHQRDRLLEGGASDPRAAHQLNSILDELTALENELTLIETDLRDDITSPSRVLIAPEIQSMIDPDSVLLQYTLGEDRSFVWAITRDSMQSVELADRKTIEAAARKAFEGLETFAVDARSRRQLNDDLAVLSHHVLKPVFHLIGKPRVLVAADGALHYIPFSVLPADVDGVSAPLITMREVVSLPSVSVLAAQRARAAANPPAKMLAVFADPVLESTDERLNRSQYAATTLGSDVASVRTRSSMAGQLQRLVATRDEAEYIAKLVPENSRLVAQGFKANRETVLNADLSQYRFVHFATHGLVDSRYPALSSLALSQFDEDGNRVNGVLRLHDIYGMSLNADLVVLSACETALGREVRGEGLVGLSQGFLYSGARSLVVSLWQVPDRATAELMSQFYKFMINEGLRPAAALRKAQNAIASERRWRDPYFWAPFVLLGDWQ